MIAASRLWSAPVAIGLAGLIGLALCFSPVSGIPGLESALVLGVTLPAICAFLGARMGIAARKREGELGAGVLIGDAVLSAVLVLTLPVLFLTLNLIRVPACAPLVGYGFLLLGPLPSVVLSVSVGLFLGLALRPKIATTLAILIPIAWMLYAVARFYASPAIFSYGHFFGYFPGTLYDPEVALTGTYATLRAITIGWTLASWCAIAVFWDPRERRLRFSRWKRQWRVLLALKVVALASMAGEIHSTDLGHSSTPSSIAEALGGRIENDRCIIVFPREMPRRDANRLAADCAFRVGQIERSLGVRQPHHITAFFFRSADEKRELMGASNTYIAKPWREEVYLQIAEWPHPVLFHELTHVVAGNVGRGPFRVSGSFGGLLPAPAIIEGVAVAIAWDEADGLTPHQWARAMLELELMPPLRSVDGLDFLLQPAGRAYITTGSFVRWLMETRGNAVVRRLYMSGDLEGSLGQPLEEAERQWHQYLRTQVQLPSEARALAQMRFERPGIFGQICPHRIADLRSELGDDLGAGDDHAAIESCRAILELDSGQADTRASLAEVLARRGELGEAEQEIRRLVGPPAAASPIIASARLGVADARWRRGESQRALEIYRSLVTQPMSEDETRQIEVRIIAIESGGESERLLRELLVPRRDVTNDAATVMHVVDALANERHDGLGNYLVARQMLARQRFPEARALIAHADVDHLPTQRLRDEARRIDGSARVGVGDLDGGERIWRAIAADQSASEGRRVHARDWLARIRALRAARAR